MEIELDLSRHCIQTAARRQYERRLASCLRPGGGEAARQGAEAEVELLRRALETVDFGRLRSGWKPLNGGPGVRVRLAEEDGVIVVRLGGERIAAPLRDERCGQASRPRPSRR